MTEFLDRSGLSVDSRLADFIEQGALPGTELDVAQFWSDFAGLLAKFAPENAALLAKREDLQAKIAAWHKQPEVQGHEHAPYQAFLREIGTPASETAPFSFHTPNVDPSIAPLQVPLLITPSHHSLSPPP